MTVIYVLVGSAVLMLVFAALFWTGTIDVGMEPMPIVLLLVGSAVMDLLFAAIFLRKLSR